MRFVWLMKDEDGTIINFMPSLVLGVIAGNALIVAIVWILCLAH